MIKRWMTKHRLTYMHILIGLVIIVLPPTIGYITAYNTITAPRTCTSKANREYDRIKELADSYQIPDRLHNDTMCWVDDNKKTLAIYLSRTGPGYIDSQGHSIVNMKELSSVTRGTRWLVVMYVYSNELQDHDRARIALLSHDGHLFYDHSLIADER